MACYYLAHIDSCSYQAIQFAHPIDIDFDNNGAKSASIGSLSPT